VVAKWWAWWPDARPATPDGLVVDLDEGWKDGRLRQGRAAWRALGIRSSTIAYDTPTGPGRHLFYRGDVKGNATGDLPAGIDIRGQGTGYVVIYHPEAITVGPDEWPVPPPELLRHLRATKSATRDSPPSGGMSRALPEATAAGPLSVPLADEFGDPARTFTLAEAGAYVEEGALAPLRSASPGGRNRQLNESAMVCGHFVPAFWSPESVTSRLVHEALTLGLNAEETYATVRSGLAAGMAEPYVLVAGPGEEPAAPEPDAVDALLAKMLDRDALDSIPEPEPLIGQLLFRDSESWIIGAPGGFKSFVALDWAAHVGAGQSWRGLPVRRGDVVYIAAEGQKGIPQRVRAWEAVYGRRLAGVRFLPEPVQVKGADTDRTGHPAVGWLTLVEACRRIKPVLIVLDTQARITVGLEENSNTAMGVLIEAIRLLKAATGACVLVVHHTGRNGRDARGASALDGAQDTEIRVDRPVEHDERAALHAVISVDKNKDATEELRFEIQLEVQDLGPSVYGGRITSLALKPLDLFGSPVRKARRRDAEDNLTNNQAEILEIMRRHSDMVGATTPMIRRWILEARREQFSDGAREMADGSASTAVNALIEKDLLTRSGVSRVILTERIPEE
jgi:hypothetical protein